MDLHVGSTPPERARLSQRVIELIDDILDAFPDRYKELIPLAIMAWNATLVTPVEKDEMVHDILTDLKVTESDVPSITDLFDKLMRRKKQRFPDDRRMIIDCQITPIGSTFNLRVVSHDLDDEGDELDGGAM